MLNRRDFVTGSAGGILALATGEMDAVLAAGGTSSTPARVALVKNLDRFKAVPTAIELLGINPVRGKKVLLKPNFNTADPFPAGTHNDTLRAYARTLKGLGAAEITIGERCGPPETAEVLRKKGISELCREEGLGLINFEELPEGDWVRVRPAASHWRDGFLVARPVLSAECVVTTCCLKTHGYGGVFTMSLKLAVGITSKSNMTELHSSLFSMRKMIAEINQAYTPRLIIMDGLEVFSDGGPAHGTLKKPGVILAGTDRVAMDAVGLAVLKQVGSNSKIMETPIFAQEQIARAVELGLGISSPRAIELVTGDEASRQYGEQLREVLGKEVG
jgi:uncharacterized protein (DUF362 family)